MDPNACVERIELALCCEDWLDAVQGCKDMFEWMGNGGFLPSRNVEWEFCVGIPFRVKNNIERLNNALDKKRG